MNKPQKPEPKENAAEKTQQAQSNTSGAHPGGPKTDAKTETDKSDTSRGPVSETIERMTQSPAALPGQSVTAAAADKTQEKGQQKLQHIRAKDIMQKDILWGNAEDSVEDALSRMEDAKTYHIMVGRASILQAIVLKADLEAVLSPYLRPEFAKWRRPLDDATLRIKIKWVMHKSPSTVRPDAPLHVIIERMREAGVHVLPVTDDVNTVLGVVTVRDVLGAFLECQPPREIEDLKSESA